MVSISGHTLSRSPAWKPTYNVINITDNISWLIDLRTQCLCCLFFSFCTDFYVKLLIQSFLQTVTLLPPYLEGTSLILPTGSSVIHDFISVSLCFFCCLAARHGFMLRRIIRLRWALTDYRHVFLSEHWSVGGVRRCWEVFRKGLTGGPYKHEQQSRTPRPFPQKEFLYLSYCTSFPGQ